MRKVIMSCLLVGVAVAAVWDPTVRLTDNTWSDYSYWTTQRRIAVDQQGRVHVAWYAMNSGLGTYRFQVYYKRWTPAAGWSSDTMISADLYAANTYCKYASIAVDSAGMVWATWCGGSTDAAAEAVYIKGCVPTDSGNGGWDATSRLLSTSAPTVDKNCPTLTATPDGHVHAAWLEGNYSTIVYSERIDTTWQPPVTVEGGSGYRAYPAIAGGPDNRLHLIWYGRPGTSGFYDVYYKSRTGTTWGATEEVSYGQRHQMYPNIAVNPATGNPHVLWQCYTPENYRRAVHAWRSSGGWQPTDTLSEPGDTLNQDMGQIIFTPDGIGHAVWYGRNPVAPSIQIRYAERSAAGVWSAPFNVTDTASSKERPSIAAGGPAAPNDIHVVWTDYLPGNAEIYYAHAAPGTWVEERTPLDASRITPNTAIVRGFLNLRSDVTNLTSDVALVDASGRRVLALKAGANDISGLAPGVYHLVPGGRVLVLK